jgi:hypothetical protein
VAKKRARTKPRIERVEATPANPFTPQRKKKIHKLVNKRLMRDRKRYPEVRGKVVDYIRHSVDEGTLAVTVAFKDQTAFFLRYACQLFPVAVDLSDWKTGNMKMIREYMRPIPT